MSLTFVVPSPQMRMFFHQRPRGPLISAVLRLDSLTPLAFLPASFLRCYVSCAFVVSRSVVSVTLVVSSRKYVWYSGYVPFVFCSMWFCFWSLSLLSPPCLLLFCTVLEDSSLLSVNLFCRLRFFCLLRKYVCYSVFASLVPSSLRFCFWSLLLPLLPCLRLLCAPVQGTPLLSWSLLCWLRLLCFSANTSGIPASSPLSFLLRGFATGVSYSSRLLACFFSALLCKLLLFCR